MPKNYRHQTSSKQPMSINVSFNLTPHSIIHQHYFNSVNLHPSHISISKCQPILKAFTKMVSSTVDYDLKDINQTNNKQYLSQSFLDMSEKFEGLPSKNISEKTFSKQPQPWEHRKLNKNRQQSKVNVQTKFKASTSKPSKSTRNKVCNAGPIFQTTVKKKKPTSRQQNMLQNNPIPLSIKLKAFEMEIKQLMKRYDQQKKTKNFSMQVREQELVPNEYIDILAEYEGDYEVQDIYEHFRESAEQLSEQNHRKAPCASQAQRFADIKNEHEQFILLLQSVLKNQTNATSSEMTDSIAFCKRSIDQFLAQKVCAPDQDEQLSCEWKKMLENITITNSKVDKLYEDALKNKESPIQKSEVMDIKLSVWRDSIRIGKISEQFEHSRRRLFKSVSDKCFNFSQSIFNELRQQKTEELSQKNPPSQIQQKILEIRSGDFPLPQPQNSFSLKLLQVEFVESQRYHLHVQPVKKNIQVSQLILQNLCLQLFELFQNRILLPSKIVNKLLNNFGNPLARTCAGFDRNCAEDYMMSLERYLLKDILTPNWPLLKLSDPASPSELQILRSLRVNVFPMSEECVQSQFEYEEFVLSTQDFLACERALANTNLSFISSNTSFEESQFKQNCLHVYHKSVFDALNEALEYERVFGIWGKPFTWKSLPNFYHKRTTIQLQKCLLKARKRTLFWSSFESGRLQLVNGFEGVGDIFDLLSQYVDDRQCR